jgi:hypothetical protein
MKKSRNIGKEKKKKYVREVGSCRVSGEYISSSQVDDGVTCETKRRPSDPRSFSWDCSDRPGRKEKKKERK